MKAASEAYKELEDDARSHLQASMRITEKVMSIKDIKKEGGRIFQSMQKKVITALLCMIVYL